MAQMRLCCVMGKARNARSNVRRMSVMTGCFVRNLRYISQIRGILLSRINARSKSALTLLYSFAKSAGFKGLTCLTRYVRY